MFKRNVPTAALGYKISDTGHLVQVPGAVKVSTTAVTFVDLATVVPNDREAH